MPDALDEFYVGYLPQAPTGLARFTRAAVTLLVCGALVLTLALAAAQHPFARSHFEYGTTRSFEGRIEEHPYPALLVDRPGDPGAGPARSRWLLTVFGKRGAGAAVAGLDGRRVQVQGTLIWRDGRTMVEVVPGSIRSQEPVEGVSADVGESLGTRTYRGEIVDSKCFFGVMKPGNLKPHRACATRCISGGVPPVLLVRDAEGIAEHLLLVGADGGPVNDDVLDMIAEPVEVTGELLRYDDLLVLRADPSTYLRVE